MKHSVPYLHENGERDMVGVVDEHGPEKDEAMHAFSANMPTASIGKFAAE